MTTKLTFNKIDKIHARVSDGYFAIPLSSLNGSCKLEKIDKVL